MSFISRDIAYSETIHQDDWVIKVYTITKEKQFRAKETYQAALEKINSWLRISNQFNDENDGLAFLIIHEGSEGVFSILNWWVGGNMLNTRIYLSEYFDPTSFRCISDLGLAPCVWELEVIDFERKLYIEHIMKAEPKNKAAYISDTLTMRL